MKKLTASYLYADGHAVLLFEKQDKQAGNVEWVEIYEKWTDARLDFKGRITFHRLNQALFALTKRAYAIRAKVPSVTYGSEATKKLGLCVGSLTVEMSGEIGDSLCFHDMPGTLSGPYTYQPEYDEAFDPVARRWAQLPVGKIHRVKVPAPVQVAA